MRILSRFTYALTALLVLIEWLEHIGPSRSWSAADLTDLAIRVAVLMAVASGLEYIGARRRQRGRDRKADSLPLALYRRLQALDPTVDPPPFVLYLRPFVTTGRLTIRNPKRTWLPLLPGYFENRRNIELETSFAAALDPVIPLIGLGRPGEHVGAGRIETSDRTWWELFRTLADGAERILVLPSWEGEMRREMAYLRAPRLLEKTIFVMPPVLSNPGFDISDYWDRLRDRARELGLTLPAYTPAGELFALGRNGRVGRTRLIGRPTEERLREAFLGITRPRRKGR